MSISFGRSGARALGMLPAVMLLLCASLLVALEAPSKPFLAKNSFYLSSAGFRVQLANDPAGQKAMHALPAHRFVIHKFGNDVRYLYAEPSHCVCVFIGTQANYEDYRDILSRPLPQADDVAPVTSPRPAPYCTATPTISICSMGPIPSRNISGSIIEAS